MPYALIIDLAFTGRYYNAAACKNAVRRVAFALSRPILFPLDTTKLLDFRPPPYQQASIYTAWIRPTNPRHQRPSYT